MAGFTQIANDILERLATIKLSPTQYRLLFVIWRFTYGFDRDEHELSLGFLSEATGCDRRQIQRELKGLEDKKIIYQTIGVGIKRMIGFNKNVDDWSETVGEIDNTPEETIGETTNRGVGETDNSSDGTIGEIVNSSPQTVGEIDNRNDCSVGETTNQDIKDLKDLKDLKITVSVSDAHETFQTIRDHFVKRRGRGFDITLDEESLMLAMITDGIPVDFITQSIDRAFDTYKPKHRLDKINTFKYIAPRCYDEWIKHNERIAITENVPSEPVALGYCSPVTKPGADREVALRKNAGYKSKSEKTRDFLKQSWEDMSHEESRYSETFHDDPHRLPQF